MLVPSSSYLVALHLFRGSLLHALLNEMKGIDNKCWRCRGTKRVVKSSLKLLMALLLIADGKKIASSGILADGDVGSGTSVSSLQPDDVRALL